MCIEIRHSAALKKTSIHYKQVDNFSVVFCAINFPDSAVNGSWRECTACSLKNTPFPVNFDHQNHPCYFYRGLDPTHDFADMQTHTHAQEYPRRSTSRVPEWTSAFSLSGDCCEFVVMLFAIQQSCHQWSNGYDISLTR